MLSTHISYVLFRQYDGRTRADRLHLQNEAWGRLLPDLSQAYLDWAHHGPPALPSVDSNIPCHASIKCIDIFGVN